MSTFVSSLIGPAGPVGMVMAPGTPAPGRMPGQDGPGPLGRRPLLQAGLRALRGQPAGGNMFDASVTYRSVYLPISRNLLPRSLDVFDFAEPSMVIGQRETSNTPAQALYLLNNAFVMEQSDALARRLQQDADSLSQQVELAFELVFCRPPDSTEVAASLQFLENAAPANNQMALSAFCQALFASAEFRYVN